MQTANDITVVTLRKRCGCGQGCDADNYVWLYRRGQERDVIRSVGRMAANPELSLSWYDAVQIIAKVKRKDDE